METHRRHVALVTDSTADLPKSLCEQYRIHIVPQILILGERTWLDGVDIDPPAFYELLRTSPRFPTTSQPSVATFHELFSRVAKEADGIVAIHISAELSGTLSSALTAAQSLPGIPLEIIDSRAASMQSGLIVLAAARVAEAGGDLQAVAAAARALVNQVRVYFVVETLEYLHRGGRIGAATRLLGTALNLKPVLEVRDGIVSPVARIRTRRKALDKVLELLQEEVQDAEQVHMAVLHVAAPQEAARFAAEAQERFSPVELITAECGPVIGAHAGPGTVGIAFYAERA